MHTILARVMHGLGDSSVPLPESVKLVEEILMEQLKIILRKATECAICRGSPGNLVAEDFVFLMRRNHGKLRRLLQYL
ncbi:unnamed protein product, partial [Notodromas monacha]